MRVVHVVRQFAPSVGGIEDVVLNLARRQRQDHGIDARVVTLDTLFADRATRLPAHDVVDGIPVDRVRWWGSTRYPIAPGVLRHLRHADIVQIHAIDFFIDFLAVTRPLHRCKLVVLTHGGIFHTARQARLKRLWFNTVTRLSLRACGAVVAVSANDAALFAPLRPPNLVTIQNGADLDKLRSAAPAIRLPHRILCLGRFAPHKRIDALFPLLEALRRGGTDWTLVVAGVEWGETATGLAAQAAAAGVADAVRFVVGASNDALAHEASQATWFISASAFEGFGLAAVEAAAAGLIPILSRIPPFEHLAAMLPAAILFDPSAPEGTAAAIQALAVTPPPGIADTLARAAAPFDWGHAAARHVTVLRAVLDRSTPQERLQHPHLRPVSAIQRLDREHILAPERPGGPVRPP